MEVRNHETFAVGAFPNEAAAEQAIHQLSESGFPMDQVSVLAKRAEKDDQLGEAQMTDHLGNKDVGAPTGVVTEVANNAFWGTVLVGLTSLAIPGAGPILAAGSLGAGLLASVAGTGYGAVATEGLVRAIADMGIPKEQARVYSDHLLASEYLVFVNGAESELTQATEILNECGVEDLGTYQPANA